MSISMAQASSSLPASPLPHQVLGADQRPVSGSLGRQLAARGSHSLADLQHMQHGKVRGAVNVPQPRASGSGWHPASMPEHLRMLSGGSSDVLGDPRWGATLAPGVGSAPDGARALARSASAGGSGAPASAPVFSPFELKNMMDEQSLELFESQSHLLDPESRVLLQKQRQYLQWANSQDEPGPMQVCGDRGCWVSGGPPPWHWYLGKLSPQVTWSPAS